MKVSDLKLWQLALSQRGLSPKSIKNNRGVFNYILKDAFADDLIKKNFFQFVEVIPLIEPEIYPFNLEEVNTLIKNASGWFKNYITLAFLTGLRTGEILGLRWCDVDFGEGVINIRQAISDGVISTPKTKASIREIDMLPQVKKALMAQYKITGSKKAGYIFLTQHDRFYTKSDSITVYAWKPLLEKCHIQYRILYQMRHTFASIMIQQGEEIGWVSSTMGHKSIYITMQSLLRGRSKKEQFFLIS